MKDFKVRAINTSSIPLDFEECIRMLPFFIHKMEHRNLFLENIPSIDFYIQFTTEKSRSDRSMPFLDTLVTPEQDRTLFIAVYRKPAHTDQYLHWGSHQTLC